VYPSPKSSVPARVVKAVPYGPRMRICSKISGQPRIGLEDNECRTFKMVEAAADATVGRPFATTAGVVLGTAADR